MIISSIRTRCLTSATTLLGVHLWLGVVSDSFADESTLDYYTDTPPAETYLLESLTTPEIDIDTSTTEADAEVELEIHCLALNIYFEARSEPEQGQRAAGHVVMNRVADKHQRAGVLPGAVPRWQISLLCLPA